MGILIFAKYSFILALELQNHDRNDTKVECGRMDREGMPHTDKLHLIERFTRTDFNSMKYEMTIDDPGAYTAAWKTGFFLRWSPAEFYEFICQENNQVVDVTGPPEQATTRALSIVP